MAEECEGTEERKNVGHEFRKRRKGILDDKSRYLIPCVNLCNKGQDRGGTFVGFRLARSIATAPPID